VIFLAMACFSSLLVTFIDGIGFIAYNDTSYSFFFLATTYFLHYM